MDDEDKLEKDPVEEKSYLEFDAQGKPADKRLRLAVVALLWQMANIHGQYGEEEFAEVVRSVEHEFHISDAETGELIEVADYLRRESDHLDDFLKEVNERFDREQREHLFEMIWRVAEADGYLDKYENAFGELLKKKLNLASDYDRSHSPRE